MIVTSIGYNPNFRRDWYFQEGLSRINSAFGDISVSKLLYAHDRYYAFGGAGSRIAFSADLLNWTIVDMRNMAGFGIVDAAVSNTGVILAVAGDRIFRSSNGIEWENLVGYQFATSITFGNGTFVIAGGSIAGLPFAHRSTNSGTSWTDVSASVISALGSGANAAPIAKVQYKNSLFFISGTSNTTAGNPRCISSPDGTTWTTRFNWLSTQSSFGSSVRGIEWTGSSYLVHGGAGVIASGSATFVWTAQTALSATTWGANTITEINWNGSRMVAIGNGGRLAVSTATNGSSWAFASDNTIGTWAGRLNNTVLWDGSSYHVGGGATGTTGQALLASSTTGADTTWTFNNTLWKSGEYYGTIFVNALVKGAGMYVAAGPDGTLSYSPDASTWSVSTSAKTVFGTSQIATIAWNGTTFVAGGQAGKVATSTDGITWTAVSGLQTGTWTGTAATSTGWGSGNITRIIWTGSLFAAVGPVARVATSPDGVTWTVRTGLLLTWGASGLRDVESITWDGSKFLVAASATSAVLGFATSSDGITWVNQGLDTAASGGYTVIAYDGISRYVAICGFGGRLATSVNGGVTWTNNRGTAGAGTAWADLVGAGAGGQMVDIVYVAGRGWYATGDPGLLFSVDGVTWYSLTTSLIPNAVTNTFGQVRLTKIFWDTNRLMVGGDKASLSTERAGGPPPVLGAGQFFVDGLMFSKASDTDNVFATSIAGAIAAAEASTYRGYTDWRLPTYAETQSLVNAVGPAALIAGGWSAGTGDWHWTSTLQGGANYYVYAPGQTGGSPTGFSFGVGNYRIMLVRAYA